MHNGGSNKPAGHARKCPCEACKLALRLDSSEKRLLLAKTTIGDIKRAMSDYEKSVSIWGKDHQNTNERLNIIRYLGANL